VLVVVVVVLTVMSLIITLNAHPTQTAHLRTGRAHRLYTRAAITSSVHSSFQFHASGSN